LPAEPPRGPDRARRAGLAALTLAILPALAAVWSVPWFVTQDGPAHLYNARILADALGPGESSPLGAFYRIRWEPLPNWAGHLTLLGLVKTLPPAQANRVATSATLVGLAAAVAWLRWRVRGWRGMAMAGPLAALLAMNVAWLLGFTSFLLGACLFPITLGVWWSGRGGFGPRRAAALGGLMVAGYACHPVSLGLTVVGLLVLAAATPAPPGGAARRWGWTLAGLAPLGLLGLIYRGLMSRGGGGFEPTWGHLADPRSFASWVRQAGWADPVSLASKLLVPFVEGPGLAHALLAPALWLAAALATWIGAALLPGGGPPGAGERRGWWLLAALLVAGGLACPDTLGPSHGNYLPQRVVLLGLVALVPALDVDGSRRSGRIGGAALAVALAVQSAFVWEYARTADRVAGVFERAGPHVGAGRRVATLLIGVRGRFRANPLLHADNLLGVEGRNVLWSNYETRHYYFPVQFRPGLCRPDAGELEAIALMDDPRDAPRRADRWRRLVAAYADAIDVLVVWGSDPGLDAIDAGRFEAVHRDGPLRVLRRRERRLPTAAGVTTIQGIRPSVLSSRKDQPCNPATPPSTAPPSAAPAVTRTPMGNPPARR